MKDKNKTRQQLINELAEMRQRIAELEVADTERKRAEEQVLVANERLQYLLSASSAVIYASKTSGDYGATFISNNVIDMTGYEAHDFLDDPSFWIDHIHPDDIDRVKGEVAQVLDNGRHSYDYRFQHKDGRYIWVRDDVKLVRNTEGEPIEIVGFWTDITEHKRAEEALRESEEKLRVMFESTSEGIAITDLKGKILDVNDTILGMSGLSREELVGQEGFGFVPTEDGKRIIEQGMKAIISETGTEKMSQETTPTFGRAYDVDLSIGVLHDSSGDPTGFVAIARDDTERKRAKEMLQQREQDYLMLLESTAEGIIVVDSETLKVVFGNRRAMKMFEFESVEDGIGVNILDFIEPEDREIAIRGFAEDVFGEEQRKRYELRANTKAGRQIWIRALATRIDFQGRVAVLLSIRDITERKLVDDEIRESEERYRLLAENVTDVIWTVDMDLRFTYISPSVERISGYSVEEAMAQSLADSLCPDSLEVALQAYEEELALEEMEQKDLFRTRTLELQQKCKDGSTIWTEVTMTFLHNADGQSIGILGVSRDITERKLAEEDLRESEEKLRAVFEHIGDGVIVSDLEGRITDENDAALRMQGFKHKKEVIGKNGFDFIAEKDRTKALEDGVKTVELGRGPGGQYTFLRKDGSEYEGEAIASLLRDSSGNPAGFVSVTRDITERKLKEEELRESEERYRLLAENVTDVIWTLDMNLQVTYISPSITRQRGYSVEESLTRGIEKDLTPASLEIAMKVFSEALAAEEMEPKDLSKTWTVESELYCKDGSTIWTEQETTFLRDADGQPVGILGVSRDITERKLKEEELRESEERYRLLAENVTDVIWTMDMDMRFTYTSPSITHQRGYSVEEAMAQSLVDNLCPDSLEVALQAYEEELAIEEMEQKDLFRTRTLELEQKCKDGSTICTEVTMTFLRNADGQAIGILGVSRDITERKLAEEALRESEYRLQELVENIGSGVAVYKPINGGKDFVFLNLNKAGEKIGGISKEKVIGKTVTEVLPGIKKFGLLDVFQRVNETGKSEHFPISFYEDERIKGWRENFVYKLPSGELVAVYEDISERKRAEEERERLIHELERSNAELQQFAHVASHDLQEPLRMVASYTQLLEKRYKGNLDADADEFIAYAVDGAQRMQNMIESLLYYSRVGSRGKPLQPVESESAFEQAMADLKLAIDESSAEMTHDPLPQVMADKTQLIQLFQNLLGNAVKFRGKEQPHIHVSAKQDKNEYLFSVSDNGIGMNPEYFDRIFVIFQRLHGREEYPGTGMGLSICRRIIERQGGRIWVESKPGEGSTFYFTIPKGSEE